jgi:hypothetical protein
MSEQEQANSGRDAALVLENPAYIAAMKLMRESITDMWRSCPLRDAEGQLLLLQTMRLADTFEAVLSGMVQAGKMAAHKLDIDGQRNESGARKLLRRVL